MSNPTDSEVLYEMVALLSKVATKDPELCEIPEFESMVLLGSSWLRARGIIHTNEQGESEVTL